MIKLFSHSFVYAITGNCHEHSAILPISVNLALLRIAIVVRIPVSGKGILTILRTSGNQAEKSNRKISTSPAIRQLLCSIT